MNAERVSRRWFVTAILYLVIGTAFGVYMGASHDHSLYTVHSHISLVGWVSMGLMGLMYRAFPAAAQTRLAAWHFWLYQVSAPVMLVAVAFVRSGMSKAEPAAGASSVALLVSVLMFGGAVLTSRDGEAAINSR